MFRGGEHILTTHHRRPHESSGPVRSSPQLQDLSVDLADPGDQLTDAVTMGGADRAGLGLPHSAPTTGDRVRGQQALIMVQSMPINSVGTSVRAPLSRPTGSTLTSGRRDDPVEISVDGSHGDRACVYDETDHRALHHANSTTPSAGGQMEPPLITAVGPKPIDRDMPRLVAIDVVGGLWKVEHAFGHLGWCAGPSAQTFLDIGQLDEHRRIYV